MDINPTRNFNLAYIILDSVFILVLLALLFLKKKYRTLLWSLFGGALYFLVDFGYFYLISGSRKVLINGTVQGEGYTALILLWMSLSYGITNFVFIWLCLDKDKNLKEWLILIIGWWLIAPSLAALGGERIIQTTRTTGKYHWIMALFLVVGYLYLIIRNLFFKKEKVDILKLNLIGISVQFAWEAALLINGIRPLDSASLVTLLVDSLLETNLGMPYFYFIHKYIFDQPEEEKELSLNNLK
ncbi:MAG: hypothetical protein LKJ88_03685 [Bacilli bacterium]|jgi:hypothetical protein|nr:hypothetical protein [Bacilli bacterium]